MEKHMFCDLPVSIIEPRISSFALSKMYGLERREKRKKDCGNQLPNDVAASTSSSPISLYGRLKWLAIVAKGGLFERKSYRHAFKSNFGQHVRRRFFTSSWNHRWLAGQVRTNYASSGKQHRRLAIMRSCRPEHRAPTATFDSCQTAPLWLRNT